METPCRSFDDHPFRWPPRARRDICSRGAPPMGFMPENRFGAGGKRGLCRSQSQAGLAVSFALVGVGGGGIVRIRVWISRQGARCVRFFVRFVRISVLLSMNLGDRRGLRSLGSAITIFFATPHYRVCGGHLRPDLHGSSPRGGWI